MIGIFQVIGKPDNYESKDFIINGKRYKSCLCSDAFRDFLKSEGKDAKLTIFVPESFLVDENIECFCDKIKEKGIYDFDAIAIPSVGTYKSGNEEFSFLGSVETISTSIFLHFVKMRPDEIYVDISTGLNIYPVNLLEAVKRYLTYRKLERILQSDYRIKAHTIFSPPISKDVDEYLVEVQPIDVKAFFSLPNANVDRIASSKEINKRYGKVKKKVRNLFSELKIAYNSIRLNTPLAFYEILKMDAPVEEIERELFDFIDAVLEPVRNGNVVGRFQIDGVNVSNVFYSLAMYKSIQEFAKTLSNPELDEIFKAFSSIYRIKHLGLAVNEHFLVRDIEEIKSLKIEEGMEDILAKLKFGEIRGSKDKERNFFAHSGFLYEYTILKAKDGKIFVGWIENARREIKKWLSKH